MKRTVRKLNGLHPLHPNGSLVFCETCEKILGSINERGYNYINIALVCTCGNYGKIEIIKGGHENDITKSVNKMPKIDLNVNICRKCERPLFQITDGRVKSYSFYAECVCGERYDRKVTFDKRLGETLKKYSKIKKTLQL